MTYNNIHKDFRLNGISYSGRELRKFAKKLIDDAETFEQTIGHFLLDWISERPSVRVPTSGSTGKPKHIDLQKHHMINSALATGEFFGLKSGCTALLCLPVDFIAGKMMLVRAMVLGLKLDYVAPSSNPLDRQSEKYDFCAMVPLQLENSINELHKVKTLIVGGAPLSAKILEQVQERGQSTQIFETYGMTETSTHIALKKIQSFGSRRQNFKTLPGVKIDVDYRNCLVIEAPTICDYIINTNDVVDLVSDSEFRWLGRYDNVINSGGIKLFPERIEAKLTPIIKSRFFVAGVPDEKLGQKLVLFVEGETDIDTLSKKIDSLASIGEYEVPKAIHVLSAFLETETGKIKRKETLSLLAI